MGRRECPKVCPASTLRPKTCPEPSLVPNEAKWVARHTRVPCPQSGDAETIYASGLPLFHGWGGLLVSILRGCRRGTCIRIGSASGPGGGLRHSIQRAYEEALKKRCRALLAHGLSSPKAALSVSDSECESGSDGTSSGSSKGSNSDRVSNADSLSSCSTLSTDRDSDSEDGVPTEVVWAKSAGHCWVILFEALDCTKRAKQVW